MLDAAAQRRFPKDLWGLTMPGGDPRALTLDDLAALARRFATERDPARFYAAVDALVQQVIGHRLFTLMRVDESRTEVERVYSSNVTAYPVGGRKQKRGTPWSRVVLDRGEVFVARTPEEIRAAFADHALIESLGVSAIMNVPIAWAGRSIGTMNILHEAGWFTEQHESTGRLIAPFLVPALLGS
jgi:hypothetical protein